MSFDEGTLAQLNVKWVPGRRGSFDQVPVPFALTKGMPVRRGVVMEEAPASPETPRSQRSERFSLLEQASASTTTSSRARQRSPRRLSPEERKAPRDLIEPRVALAPEQHERRGSGQWSSVSGRRILSPSQPRARRESGGLAAALWAGWRGARDPEGVMRAALDARQKQRRWDQRNRMVDDIMNHAHSKQPLSALVEASRNAPEGLLDAGATSPLGPNKTKTVDAVRGGPDPPKVLLHVGQSLGARSPVYGLQLTPRSPPDGKISEWGEPVSNTLQNDRDEAHESERGSLRGTSRMVKSMTMTGCPRDSDSESDSGASEDEHSKTAASKSAKAERKQALQYAAEGGAEKEIPWPFGNHMRERAGERAGRSLSVDRSWTGLSVDHARASSADRSWSRASSAAPLRVSSSENAQGKTTEQPAWPFGTRMQQRIEQRALGVKIGAGDAELADGRRQAPNHGAHQAGPRPFSAPTRSPTTENAVGPPARKSSRGRPPWRPSGSATVAGEERERASERQVQAGVPARAASLERLVSVSPVSRGVSDDLSESYATRVEPYAASHERGRGQERHVRDAHAAVQPVGGEAAMEMKEEELRMKAPLQHMLDAINYAYGVDLAAAAGEQGNCPKTDEPLSMQALGRAMSDGVSLCRLATCVQRVAQTKTSCMPLSPLSSAIRGWTLKPTNRSQRLNNIRIALGVLRSDARVKMQGHASHWTLMDPDEIEHGDADAARNVICIIYDALAQTFPLSPEKAKTGRSGLASHVSPHVTHATHASRVHGAGSVRGDEPPAVGHDGAQGPPGADCDAHGGGTHVDVRNMWGSSVPRSRHYEPQAECRVTALACEQQHVRQPARRARSVSRSLSPAAARPLRSHSAAARGRPAGAADAAAAEQENCEDAEDTVIYHAPVNSIYQAPVNSECHAPVNNQWAPAQRRSCAEGCGGWEQVERLLAADRAQPALDGHFLGSGANGTVASDARPSLLLQMHTCRSLVTLNLLYLLTYSFFLTYTYLHTRAGGW